MEILSCLTLFKNPETGELVPLQLDDNFCGFFPEEEKDEISFIGPIKTIQEYSVEEINGKMLTVAITPDFDLDIFIAQTHIKSELSVGQSVSGLAWLQGTIEKS